MVAIKDFGMPSCCENCNMCDNRDLDTFYCCITLNDVNIDEKDHDCPLVEIGTCKDCKYNVKNTRATTMCDIGHRFYMRIPDTFYCADFEKRGDEDGSN